MHVTLIVPAPFTTVSGGYGYDRRIVSGLRALGHTVAVTEVPGTYPIADEIARDAVCAALDAAAPGSKIVIDGLALPAFVGLDDALAARGAVGLIHHPTSLETGTDEAARATLRDIEQRLFRRLRTAIVTSEPTGAGLSQVFGVDPTRIRTVVPGTEDAPRCMGSGQATCQILAIGTLIPRKGHDLLMMALSRLFDLDWHLTIVGSETADPACAAQLRAMAGAFGLEDKVTFAGVAVDAALERLWQSADIFALATHYEGYGMAIAEALKRGLPVVVTAGGAAGSMISPEAGMVCPVGDRDQLSKTLRRVIFSPALRRDIADAAWELGKTLPSWEQQAALFASALAS